MGKVRSIREWDGKSSDETRYFISSRKLTAAEFGKAVRCHWAIENSLHWVMDMVFRDDECRVRTRNAAANFVTIKHIALNMLKQVKRKASMHVKRKLAAWDNSQGRSVLHELTQYCACIMAKKQTESERSLSAVVAQNMVSR